jgi:hypothetical protein
LSSFGEGERERQKEIDQFIFSQALEGRREKEGEGGI